MDQILHCDYLPKSDKMVLSFLLRITCFVLQRNRFFHINPLYACLVRMVGYWTGYFSVSLWTLTPSRSLTCRKKNLASIQASWTHTWSIIHMYVYIDRQGVKCLTNNSVYKNNLLIMLLNMLQKCAIVYHGWSSMNVLLRGTWLYIILSTNMMYCCCYHLKLIWSFHILTAKSLRMRGTITDDDERITLSVSSQNQLSLVHLSCYCCKCMQICM